MAHSENKNKSCQQMNFWRKFAIIIGQYEYLAETKNRILRAP